MLARAELSVVVRFVVKEGEEVRFRERAARQAVESLQDEPECRVFDVCVDPDDARRILLYEIYTSEAAFGQHLQTSHFRSFDADTRAWVDEKTVERWLRLETTA